MEEDKHLEKKMLGNGVYFNPTLVQQQEDLQDNLKNK